MGARMLVHLHTNRCQVCFPPPGGREWRVPRPIGYVSAAPLAGKVRVYPDLWWKAWPEFIVLFFVGVVFVLTYLLLATVTEDLASAGLFSSSIDAPLATFGLPCSCGRLR